MTFDFKIEQNGQISKQFNDLGILNFQAAAKYIRQLPYKRNSTKTDELIVFTDGCGTCSTKHALLAKLASEHGRTEVSLFMGVFKMHSQNAPKISQTLKTYQLDYIPEAHNYLKVNGEILDCTSTAFGKVNFIHDLLEETTIQPDQVTDFKVDYHKQFLDSWRIENHIPYSLEELWKIREACILSLSQ